MLSIVFQTSAVDVVISEIGMTDGEIMLTHPDLILLAIQIKGYINTGDEICMEIKSHKYLQSIPVFLISSEPNLDIIAFECSADGFFSKPFDILKLKSVIRDKML